MEAQSSSRGANIDEDLIRSATRTSVEEILGALAGRGCSNLTSSIDMTTYSDLPCAGGGAGGGACDVYRGVLNDGTGIAIKTLRIYGDKERVGLLKSAARELCHWSKLQHRNVLPLLGLTIFREHISLVSGWMENGSLVSYLKRRPDANRIKLCMDICAGLCYIHMVDMVHGDLKAANVMISSDGTALIAGFGNAELRDLTLKFTNASKLEISLRWAAPELLDPACPQVSKEADVYAFGMTVLEVLTGKVPFYGTNEYQILCLVARKWKVPPRPDIGIRDDLWNLLNWCWTREPTARPGIASVKDRLQAMFQPPFDTWSIKENAGPSAAARPLETTRKLVRGEDDEGGEGAFTRRYTQSEFDDHSGQEGSDMQGDPSDMQGDPSEEEESSEGEKELSSRGNGAVLTGPTTVAMAVPGSGAAAITVPDVPFTIQPFGAMAPIAADVQMGGAGAGWRDSHSAPAIPKNDSGGTEKAGNRSIRFGDQNPHTPPSHLRKPYRLNYWNAPVEQFEWAEAFEIWSQRTKTPVNWIVIRPGVGIWLAEARFTVGGHALTYTGTGQTRQRAKREAVINIERAYVLRV